MTIENALASVAVKDLKAAAAWYEKLFRRPADLTPMPEVADWKFARGGWLQVYQIPERAGGSWCTLAVRDIDPDGNHLAFAESDRPGNGALATCKIHRLTPFPTWDVSSEAGSSKCCTRTLPDCPGVSSGM